MIWLLIFACIFARLRYINLCCTPVTHYTKSVLLVDDNKADLLLFQRLLKKAGLPVIPTHQPEEAIAKIVGGGIGCVLTDQFMPLSGHELVQIAKGVRSDIGVVFISGADTTSQPIPPGAIFLSKSKSTAIVEAVL